MDIKDLISTARDAQEMLIKALTEYVREHGEEMNDYFYYEYAIEEEEFGEEIIKVLDISDPGCCFACQNKVNDDALGNISYLNGSDTRITLSASFHHYSIWALYIVQDEFKKETLKYYMFRSNGVEFEEDSEPDHDAVETLGLEDLRYIYEAVINKG